MIRENRHYRTAAAAMFAALALTVTGCRNDAPAAAPKETPAVSAPAQSAVNVPTATPAVPEAATAALGTPDKLAAAANAVQQAGAADTKSPNSQTPAKPQKSFDAYTADKPLLMGVAIGETKDKTVQLHGSPTGSYTMEDGDDPITVAEYDGFNIGYNKKQQVEFIEIADSSVDPGLNGLRLGQNTAAAQTALGKPDASTDYVLTYKTKGTVLKLDVDPKAKTIQSIKMFRRTE